MSSRAIGALLCGIAIGAFGTLSAQAADGTKSEIKGGIEGKIVKVDVDNGTLTITKESGRQQTFTVTKETTIVGPRGGIVHRRLKDPRFHAGLSITVVATGESASELHLGVDRKGGATSAAGSTSKPSSGSTSSPPRTTGFRGLLGSKTATEKDAAKSDEADDDDNDFPGKIKSVDAAHHMLVVTLLNGKDRSFLVAHDVKLTIGRRASTQGLSDAALKPGMSITVVTEAGGRKVKELKVSTAVSRRLRRAS